MNVSGCRFRYGTNYAFWTPEISPFNLLMNRTEADSGIVIGAMIMPIFFASKILREMETAGMTATDFTYGFLIIYLFIYLFIV